MKSNEIQSGTELFFPNALEGKVRQYVVETIRKDRDDEEQCFLWIHNQAKERFRVALWDVSETKNSDHVDMFVPLYDEFGHGGQLCFYYTYKAAQGALSLKNKVNYTL